MSSLAYRNNQLSFVNNGVLRRLPPGFCFEPTDEELIVHYLQKKVMSCPLPAFVITEVDVWKSDPWDLPGDSDQQDRYFFSTNEAKYLNGDMPIRDTGSGYWKDTGIDEQIVASDGNQLLGMKKTLVFYRGEKSGCGSKTDWIMKEYRLADASSVKSIETIKLKESLEVAAAAKDNWVLCRIFLKKEGIIKNFDLNVAPTPSSSDSSDGITSEIPFTHEPGPDEDEQTTSTITGCNKKP